MPVIGVGIAAGWVGLFAATLAFAVVIGLLALGAALGTLRSPPSEADTP